MYSFDCPACMAYLENLEVCDCGQYRCIMCDSHFIFQDTDIDQVLLRNGIYCDLMVVVADEDGVFTAPAFRDAETYKRYVAWNAKRMVGAFDQFLAMLNDDSNDEENSIDSPAES